MSVCPPTDSSSGLSRLPKELWAEVFSHVDIFSLRTLLQTWPAIRKHFLIVMDTAKDSGSQPRFFRVPGVRIVYLEDYKKVETSPNLGSVLITLFEFVRPNPEDKGGFVFFQPIMTPGLRPMTCLNRFSFVYLCIDIHAKQPPLFPYLFDELMDRMTNLYCDYTQGHVIKSKPEQKEVSLAYHHHQSIQPEIFQSVIQLEITCLVNFENISLPSAREVTLHYVESRDGSAPTLTNLAAPRVEELTVYYRKYVPIITSGARIGNKNSMALVGPVLEVDTKTKRTTFRLIQVEALEAGVKYSIPPCSTPPQLIQNTMDLSFTKNFQVHQVIGGHDILLSKLCLENVTHLVWRKANRQTPESGLKDFELSAPNLKSFNFTTSVPGTKLPAMKPSQLKDLGIIAYAADFDPNKIFDRHDFTRIYKILVAVNNDDWLKDKYVTVPIRALAPERAYLWYQFLRGCAVDPTIDRTRECTNPYLYWTVNTRWMYMTGQYAHLDNDRTTSVDRMRYQG